MELTLIRTYHLLGTNGIIYHNDQPVCNCIELPWMNNKPRISCIPEGRYELKKTYNEKFGWHLLVCGVQGRYGILIHPANDALRELKGCIAPVTALTGPGTGTQSLAALKKLLELATTAIGNIFINIKSNNHDHYKTYTGTHAKIL